MDRPPEPFQPTSLNAAQIGVVGLWALALLFTLYIASGILLPIVTAVFLAVIFYPLVRWLRRIGIPEGAGAGVTLLLVLALTGGALYFLAEPATDWLNRGPGIIDELRSKTSSLRQTVEDVHETAREVEEMTQPDAARTEVVVESQSFANQVFGFTWSSIANAAVTLFIMFFLLALGRRTVERVVDAMPSARRRDYARYLLRQLQGQVADYLQTLTVINLVLGALTGMAMALLGMPNAVLWGVVAVLLGYIPYLGPLVMLVIIAIVSFLTFDDWLRILLPIAAYGVLELIEGQFTTPWIVGRRLTLNPIAVFVFMLVWGTLWGVIGAILAIPILATVKILCDSHPSLAPVSAALGNGDRPSRFSPRGN